MITIPVETSISSYFTQSVNLGEVMCSFRFLWNLRDERWYCDFSSSEGRNDGVRIVENTPLLGDRNRIGADGDFRVLKANKSAGDRITYDNFGKDYILVWATASEWEEYDGLRTGV